MKKTSTIEITDDVVWFFTIVDSKKYYGNDFEYLPTWMQSVWFDITLDKLNKLNELIDQCNEFSGV